MKEESHIRFGWLKFMYAYTLAGAGGFGLAIIFVPDMIISIFKMPVQDHFVLGVAGSVYFAFGLLSALSLALSIDCVCSCDSVHHASLQCPSYYYSSY